MSSNTLDKGIAYWIGNARVYKKGLNREMDKVKEALNHIKSNYLRQTFREDWRENSITKSIHDAISVLNDKLDDLKKEINQ